MKKIYAINGSPRSNGNTANILQHLLAGAASAGAEVELINLGQLNFSGCRSCFACKLKEGDNYGKCALKDDLTPFLAKISDADALVMGSPVYFSAESGLFRNCLERIFFPLLEYSAPIRSLARKKMEMAFVYTMNIPEDMLDEYDYKEHLEKSKDLAAMIFGSKDPEVLYVCDTFQFSDYSKYVSGMFDPAHKAEVRKKIFPQDQQKAFDLGKKLAKE